MNQTTPNGEWFIVGTPFPGVPVYQLQRRNTGDSGYCWKHEYASYQGPAGMVFMFPPHYYDRPDNTIVGATGRELHFAIECELETAYHRDAPKGPKPSQSITIRPKRTKRRRRR